MRRGKHAPARLETYLTVHETVMAQFRDQGFIADDDLELSEVGSGVMLMTGRILCPAGLYIEVTKTIELVAADGPDVVHTTSYSYSAVLTDVGSVFRYCSPHFDHNREHHVHRFDVLAGDVSGRVDVDQDGDWPTLGEVIEELRGWYADHCAEVDAKGRSARFSAGPAGRQRG